MNFQRNAWARIIFVLAATATLLALTCCTKTSSAQTSSVDLNLNIKTPFRFVAYGDTRFHDPSDLRPSDSAVRQDLVQAIADANPAFVCITGDIVYNGNDSLDWNVWDHETSIWRERRNRQERTNSGKKRGRAIASPATAEKAAAKPCYGDHECSFHVYSAVDFALISERTHRF